MNEKRIQRYCGQVLLFVLMWTLVACAPSSTSTPTPMEQLATDQTIPSTAAPPVSMGAPATVPPYEPSPTPILLPGWASEALSEPDFIGFTENIAMTADHRGGLHVVWVTKEGGDYTGIYHLFYETKGPDVSASWSKPAEIVKASFSDERPMNLAIAVDSHNVPHVLWSMEDKILYSSQGADGSWSPSSVVVPAVCPDCLQLESPAIAINAMDEVHVLWSDQCVIRWSSKLPKGEWSPPREISTKPEQNATGAPSISVDTNDTLHVAWRQDFKIRYTFKSQGGSWAEPVVISNATFDPVVAVDSANTIHIVWYDTIRSRPEFWYTYKPLDGTWTKRQPIPVSALGESPWYGLALVGGDDLILVWRRPYSDDPINYITKRRGNFWSDLTSLPGTNEQQPYAFTGDPSGNVHLVWEPRKIGEVLYLAHAATSIQNIAQPPMVVVEPTPLPGLVEFPISTGPGERRDLDMSDNIVVWNEKGKKDWDIFGYDLATQSKFPITTREGDQDSPAISGNIVVWQDERVTSPRIYGYDLSTGQEFPITAESSPQFGPDISGNVVVFQDWRKTGTCSWGGSEFGPGTSCDWDIWGADLETKEEFPINTDQNVQTPPRISGKTVIWTQKPDDSATTIYSYQLGTASQPIQIAATSGYPYPAIDGNIVVWVDWRNGVNIFGYHSPTRSEFPIAIGPGSKGEPGISRNIVVWVDTRNGDADIYGYDLASGKEFSICTAPGDQENPAIHGDVVVWVDKRNVYTEIYGARLPSINAEQTENVVPAPTSIPTPTPAPTPIPTPTPIPATLEAPRLLSPANNSTLDTLVPVLIFDLGTEEVLSPEINWAVSVRPDSDGSGNWSYEPDGTVVRYSPDYNLTPGTTYTWQVWAQYMGSSSQVYSEEWSFTTPSKPPTLPAPVLISPVSGATVDPNSAMLQWNQVEGAIDYRVCWGDVDWGDCPDLLEWAPCTISSYEGPVSGSLELELEPGVLEPGKTYCWGVRARDDYAWSEWAEATFNTSP